MCLCVRVFIGCSLGTAERAVRTFAERGEVKLQWWRSIAVVPEVSGAGVGALPSLLANSCFILWQFALMKPRGMPQTSVLFPYLIMLF